MGNMWQEGELPLMPLHGATVEISKEHKELLDYIVTYRRTYGRSTRKITVEQLVLTYAKQLATGMINKEWREHMLHLIGEAEKEA